ncbi:MAG: hypothetical protein JWR42_2132 [Marmoricola sp.]|nr:hypothetical protein [Marmoricola sp.]
MTRAEPSTPVDAPRTGQQDGRRPSSRTRSHEPATPVWGDHLLEVATWSVAWWSVLYWAGWSLGLSLWPLGWVWAVTSLVGAVLVLLRGRRASGRRRGDGWERVDDGRPAEEPDPWLAERPRWLAVAPGAVGLVCAVLVLAAVHPWPRSGFAPLWLLPVLALAVGLAALSRGPVGPDQPVGVRRWEHVVVAGLALATGVLSLFIHLPDHDDPYYVNRSVWIAEHGTALVRDTIFGPGTYPTPYNGGIPVASIEALVGVLNHMSGVSVGTLTWLVSTFVGAVGTVWAFWALSRRWAPRLPLVVVVVAVSFMLLSGESRLGNFWIARMWQGKVLALVVLLPMIWVWADDLVRRDDRRRLVTLAVAGVAFVGLTSTAVILVPFVSGGILVAGLVLRHRRLLLGGVLLAVGPLVSGVVVLLLSTGVGANGALRTGPGTFRRVLGPDHWMVAVALVALALTPLLVRGRHVALMASSTVLATLVVLYGPLLRLAAELTGAGPILWRVLYCVPIAVLVGLLAVARPSWPWPAATSPESSSAAGRAAVALVLPALLVASFVWRGAPLWTTVDHNGPVTLTSRPTWKIDPLAQREVDAVVATGPRGVLLLPPKAMEVMPMVTTRAYALDPRGWYTRILREPAQQHRDRRALARFVRNQPTRLQGPSLRQALRTLDVTLVCVRDSKAGSVPSALAAAGFTDRTHLVDMTCVRTAR